MNVTIRSYGPGKFDTLLDSFLYELSTEGVDEELSTEGWGWQGLLLFDDQLEDEVAGIAVMRKQPLTPKERGLLRPSAGAILTESENGFVSVHYFSGEPELKQAWRELLEEYEDWIGEEEDFEEDFGEDEE